MTVCLVVIGGHVVGFEVTNVPGCGTCGRETIKLKGVRGYLAGKAKWSNIRRIEFASCAKTFAREKDVVVNIEFNRFAG